MHSVCEIQWTQVSQENKVRSKTSNPQWEVGEHTLAPVIGVFFGKLRSWSTFSVSGLHPGWDCRFKCDGASSHNSSSLTSHVTQDCIFVQVPLFVITQ